MRLLNTSSLKLRAFNVEDTPPYAVLSHTWGGQELTYVDYTEGRFRKDDYGYKKIINLCKIAKEYGIEWAWIDSCCVDYRNSVDISEVTNSCYEWFERSELCFVHLADVPSSTFLATFGPIDLVTPPEDIIRSRWFKRSWTLYELLAPREVIFLTQDWKPIGFKGPGSPRVESMVNLNRAVSAATGIPTQYLINFVPSDATVLECLEWAGRRNSARVEDVAYSLLGLFQVQMPIYYGEGPAAFTRLKREIERKARNSVNSSKATTVSRSSATDTDGNSAYLNEAGRPRERVRYAPDVIDIPYELTERGLVLRERTTNSKIVRSSRQEDYHPTTRPSSDPQETSSTASTIRPTNGTAGQITSGDRNDSTWRTCWTIIAAAIFAIGLSLGVGIYFSTEGEMGDGFTVAGYILTAGTILLAVPSGLHYNHCHCWEKASVRQTEVELHPMYT